MLDKIVGARLDMLTLCVLLSINVFDVDKDEIKCRKRKEQRDDRRIGSCGAIRRQFCHDNDIKSVVLVHSLRYLTDWCQHIRLILRQTCQYRLLL